MSWFEDKLSALSLAYFQPQKNLGMFTDSACRKPAQLEFQLSWQSAPTESQSGQCGSNSHSVPWFIGFRCAALWKCYVGTAEQAHLRGSQRWKEKLGQQKPGRAAGEKRVDGFFEGFLRRTR